MTTHRQDGGNEYMIWMRGWADGAGMRAMRPEFTSHPTFATVYDEAYAAGRAAHGEASVEASARFGYTPNILRICTESDAEGAPPPATFARAGTCDHGLAFEELTNGQRFTFCDGCLAKAKESVSLDDTPAGAGTTRVRLKILDVTPVGSTPSVCDLVAPIGNHHELPVYPESPRGKALRDLRVSRGLSLREAARAAGLSDERLGGLERGRYTLADEQWGALLDLVGRLERTTE